MIIHHHGLEIPLEDDWWEKAGMTGFVPNSSSYVVDEHSVGNRATFPVSISDVAPGARNPGIPYFKESPNEDLTAEERVGRILRGFVAGAAIPPIEVIRTVGQSYSYKLSDGVHRFYCSIAARFRHVPAVQAFSFEL